MRPETSTPIRPDTSTPTVPVAIESKFAFSKYLVGVYNTQIGCFLTNFWALEPTTTGYLNLIDTFCGINLTAKIMVFLSTGVDLKAS